MTRNEDAANDDTTFPLAMAERVRAALLETYFKGSRVED
jgi:hypothetical protein